MINKALIAGRLGKDPELRFTSSGKAVCNFSVATESVWKDRDGKKQKQTEWHNVVVWGPQAESCAKYLAKGSTAFVEGEIRTRSYDDKDGNKRFVTEIVARDVKFLGGKNEQRDDDSRRGDGTDPMDDDAPF